MTGWISQIQHGSVGDGPGLRTTVFCSGCNLRCGWCHNPETWEMRPRLLLFQNLCTRCGLCAQLCPKGAHAVTGQEHRFSRTACIGCGACAGLCPSDALRLSAREMTAEQVMEEILQDLAFYKSSGGGVTLSGGEPLLQPDFCAALAAACGQQEIPVLLDTAGDVPWTHFEKVLPHVQQVYYDFKTADEGDCLRFTGGNYARICENLARLLAEPVSVTVRIPLVPGVNRERDKLERMGETLVDLGVREVSLLPFHRLGSAKYAALDQPYPFSAQQPPEKQETEALRALFEKMGVSAWIGG